MSSDAIGLSRSATVLLGRHVSSVIGRLQYTYLSDQQQLSGSAAGQLARLRRGISGPPGADPLVWQLLFEDWPAELAPRGDAPTPAELSAHAALSLYAVHQQSKRQHKMHEFGYSLGRSTAVLARPLGEDEEQRVRRRFNALATATLLQETVHHARGLVGQFRGANIPLDYGRLASDLFLLQLPTRADQVRLQWGRDYYATPSKRPDAESAGTGSSYGATTVSKGDAL